MSNRSSLELSTRTVRIYSGAADAQARADLAAHVADEDNPHHLTADQLGAFGTLPVNAANDTAAAAAGVPVGGIYRAGSALMVRVV